MKTTTTTNKRPVISSVKGERKDQEFEERCNKYIERAKQHPLLKDYFTQEATGATWKQETSKSFFEPIMLVLAKKPKNKGLRYHDYYTRLKKQENQWSNESLDNMVGEFIGNESAKTLLKCLQEVFKRASSSADKVNTALLGDPNKQFEEDYGQQLAKEFPDVHENVKNAQPKLARNLEKSYGISLLETFIDAMLEAKRQQVKTKLQVLNKEIKLGGQAESQKQLYLDKEKLQAEFDRLSKIIDERGEKNVKETLEIITSPAKRPMFISSLVTPAKEGPVDSSSPTRKGSFFEKLLGKKTTEQKADSPRSRSPSFHAPVMQMGDKELEAKLKRARSKSQFQLNNSKPPEPPAPSM